MLAEEGGTEEEREQKSGPGCSRTPVPTLSGEGFEGPPPGGRAKGLQVSVSAEPEAPFTSLLCLKLCQTLRGAAEHPMGRVWAPSALWLPLPTLASPALLHPASCVDKVPCPFFSAGMGLKHYLGAKVTVGFAMNSIVPWSMGVLSFGFSGPRRKNCLRPHIKYTNVNDS